MTFAAVHRCWPFGKPGGIAYPARVEEADAPD